MKRYMSYILTCAVLVLLPACSKNEDIVMKYRQEIILPNDAYNLETDYKGGDLEFSFRAREDWEIIIPDEMMYDNWFTLDQRTGKAGLVTLELDVDSNEKFFSRTGSFTIRTASSSAQVHLLQKQCDVRKMRTHYGVYSSGGALNISYDANREYDLQIDCPWIRRADTRTNFDGSFGLMVEPNTTGRSRETIAYLVSGEERAAVTIVQYAPMSFDFPDPVFKAILLREYDTDNNGILSEQELYAVNTLEIESESISSFEGISQLVNLENFEINRIANFNDVSVFRECKSLTNLSIRRCPDLKTADFKGFNHLYHLTLDRNPVLEEIDVSGCLSLFEFDADDCHQLKSVDFSGCVNLDDIDIDDNYVLAQVSLSGCRNLTYFNMDEAYEIKSIDFRGCGCLKDIDIDDCREIESVLLGKLPVLDELDADNCGFTSIDLTGCPILSDIDVDDTPLHSLDLSACHKLRRLDIDQTGVHSVVFPEKNKIESLYMDDCPLLEVDLKSMPELSRLSMEYVTRKVIDLSSNYKLKQLYISYAGCETLTLPVNAPLEEMELDYNNLKSLSITSDLVSDWLYINLERNPDLEYLRLYLRKTSLELYLYDCLKKIQILHNKDCEIYSYGAVEEPEFKVID